MTCFVRPTGVRCRRWRQRDQLAEYMQDFIINDVLIVDDEHTIVDLVRSVLQEAGYECCVAYDGESALLAIEVARPALVLLDVHLPGLSGLEVAAQLHRQNLSHVPVILMTADAATAERLPTPAFPEYLFKPFGIEQLLGCVRRSLRRAGHTGRIA